MTKKKHPVVINKYNILYECKTKTKDLFHICMREEGGKREAKTTALCGTQTCTFQLHQAKFTGQLVLRGNVCPPDPLHGGMIRVANLKSLDIPQMKGQGFKLCYQPWLFM